jgi:uncharacterized protein (UPF0335 family)
MTDIRWLTYDELSSELGITRESARQLVIRKRWSKSKGNDGKARVGVPEELLQARTSDYTGDATPPDTSDDTAHNPSHSTSVDTGAEPSVIRVLTRHIERLEKERDTLADRLSAVEAERDEERLDAATVEPLKATIDLLKQALNTEKNRTDELRQERDKWSSMAEASQRQLEDPTRKPSRSLLGWLKRA